MPPAGGWGQQLPPPPKPGVIPLRPLSVGDIVNAVFTTIRYNFLAVYGPVLITGVGCIALLVTFGALTWSPLHTFWMDVKSNAGIEGWTPGIGETRDAVFALLGLLAVIVLSLLALYISSSLAAVATLRHAVVGRRVTLRQASAEGRPHLWRLVGATLLMNLVALAGVLVAVGLALAVGLGMGNAGGAVALGTLLYIPALLWAIFVQVRLVPLSAVVVLEGQRPVAALKRAWRLNAGAWWRSLGISLLMLILSSVVAQIVMTPFSLWATTQIGLSGQYFNPNDPATVRQLLLFELFYLVLLLPVSLVSNMLTLPLTPLTQGLLYIDRRIRRESLDMRLAEEAGIPFWNPQLPAQAAPHTPPTDTPPTGTPPADTPPADEAPPTV
jgi:hypothetical protein